jgi:hypothetical protein
MLIVARDNRFGTKSSSRGIDARRSGFLPTISPRTRFMFGNCPVRRRNGTKSSVDPVQSCPSTKRVERGGEGTGYSVPALARQLAGQRDPDPPHVGLRMASRQGSLAR